MNEHHDIGSMMQAGYFVSSRSKHTHSPSRSLTPPLSPRPSRSPQRDYRRTELPAYRTSQIRPPPPSVEDEVDSLAREYGSVSLFSNPEEEPSSRGDVEQYPVILEVHEHNPERRFVIVPNSSSVSDSKKSEGDGSDYERQGKDSSGEWSCDEASSTHKHGPERSERRREKNESIDTGRRAKSRPRVPDSEPRQRRDPETFRTSPTARQERFDPRVPDSEPRQRRDPETIRTSPARQERFDPRDRQENPPPVDSTRNGQRGRDFADSGLGISTSSPNKTRPRRNSSAIDDRRREGRGRRDSISPSRGSRPILHIDPRSSDSRLSNEPDGPRYRGEPQSARFPPSAYKRSDMESRSADPPRRRDDSSRVEGDPRPKPKESTARGDDTRSSDEHGVPTSRRHRRDSSSVPPQDIESTLGPEQPPRDWDRSRSRGPPVPPHIVPISPEILTNFAPKPSSTFPITKEERALPYPDDDDTMMNPQIPQSAIEPRAHAIPPISMPEFPPVVSMPEEASFEKPSLDKPKAVSPANPSSSWQVPAFDPERDRHPAESDMGSYRRYSEGRTGDKVPSLLPECPRKKPKAGKTDWLTLPRSNFNCCPSCYEGVFANTECRTLFQPMLRPTDKAISCDFGSSPWYRIAWLLTLKYGWPDLQLFHEIDDVAVSRSQACPGDRKALRNWLTIRDPKKRRLLSNFTVCYQCAKTVEVLLPNLSNVFVPVDSRSEPSYGVCALRYTPRRKRFAHYFDTFETTSDKALKSKTTPDLSSLASKIERLSMVEECREDSPVPNAYWHFMQFLPQFTVCLECFDEVVRPQLSDDNIIARNFYREPEKLEVATCQLYSERMREVFRKACRRNDPKYLEAKVLERQEVEADIHGQLMELDRSGHYDDYVQEKVDRLIREWSKWE